MADCKLKDQILTTALAMAEASSWEQLHLYAVAQKLDISLEQIRQYYPQKDDIVEAWLDIADRAVLASKPDQDFLNQNVRIRLQQVIMTWLESLAPHKRITREMLLYKLEFGHIHLQALGIMRISRTVQWFREAARIDTNGLRRILEETGTTAIYLATFARWLNDDSTDSYKTREFLEQTLQKAEYCAGKVGFG